MRVAGAREGIEELAHALASREGPTYVACANATVALHVRREVGRRLGGLFDVRFGSLWRYVDETSRLAPLAEVLGVEAARSAMREVEGPWNAFADAPGSAAQLARRIGAWDLAEAPTSLRALAEAWRSRIGDRATPEDRARAAITRAGGRRLVTFLLPQQDRAHNALIEAHADRVEITLGQVSPRAAALVDAPEPEDEVRAATRWTLAQLAAGTEPSRLALLEASADTYGGLVAEALDAAGVPHTGERRELTSTRTARACAGALSWAAGPRDAADLVDWIMDVRPSGWGDEMLRAARRAAPFGAVGGYLVRARTVSDQLAGGLEALLASLQPPEGATWPAAVRWLSAWLDQWLGDAEDETLEASARQRLDMLEVDLAPMDGWGEPPTLASLARVAATAMHPTEPGPTPYGRGVFVGALHDALGLEFDAVWVLGLTESALPPGQPSDPFWPEAPMWDALAAARLALGAACACAPSVTLSWPRGDRSQGRENAPSPWLPDAPRVSVASFHAALRAESPTSDQEARLARLLAASAAGESLADASPDLAPSFELLRARRSSWFTDFDGLIGGGARESWSPSALEELARCPMRYALTERWKAISDDPCAMPGGLTRRAEGQIVHKVLRDLLASKLGEEPQPWTDRDVAGMRAHLTRELDAAMACGLVEPGADWEAYRARLAKRLQNLLVAEAHWRIERDARVRDVELLCSGEVDLGEAPSRTIRFVGRIDRVDETPGGLVAFDYKAGRAPRGASNLDGGTRLQLAFYAHATGACEAAYWTLDAEKGAAPISYPLDDSAFRRVLAVLTELDAAGAFPARPGEDANGKLENCTHCPFDRVCPADRASAWERKKQAPVLAPYARLAEEGTE